MTPSFKIFYPLRVTILLYILILITYLDRVTIALVGVRIKAAFHLTNTKFGWVLSAFVLAYALFEIPAGLMGDRFSEVLTTTVAPNSAKVPDHSIDHSRSFASWQGGRFAGGNDRGIFNGCI